MFPLAQLTLILIRSYLVPVQSLLNFLGKLIFVRLFHFCLNKLQECHQTMVLGGIIEVHREPIKPCQEDSNHTSGKRNGLAALYDTVESSSTLGISFLFTCYIISTDIHCYLLTFGKNSDWFLILSWDISLLLTYIRKTYTIAIVSTCASAVDTKMWARLWWVAPLKGLKYQHAHALHRTTWPG